MAFENKILKTSFVDEMVYCEGDAGLITQFHVAFDCEGEFE